VVRREDREVVGAGGGDRAGWQGGHDRLVDPQPAAVLTKCLAQPVLAPVGVAADVGGHVDLVGVGLAGHLADAVDDVAAAQHEAAAALAQAAVEVAEAVGEERQPVGGGETRGVDAVVAHEERDHRVVVVQRGP
jgi:hypothetical protein